MTKTTLLHPMFPLSPPPPLLLLLLSSSSLLQLAAVVAGNSSNSTGFGMKLIHRDSIFSPLYPGNLTASQRFRRQVEYSKSYIKRLESSIMATKNDETPRPRVDYYGHFYMVVVGIGTPPTFYFLILDTGSDLTWTQCIPCDPCHNQMNEIFNPQHSSTYSNLACDDPLCKPPYGCNLQGRCIFTVTYAGGVMTGGALARESFSFLSNTEKVLTIPNIAFGCSFATSEQFFNGVLAGLFGLGGRDDSMAMQLGDLIRKRFSYCLVDESILYKHSYLHFGIDMALQEPIQSVPFVQSNFPTRYYLQLLDISLNNVYLNIPPEIFEPKPDNSGGFFIDTGAPLSLLKTEAFEILKNAMIFYFASFQLERVHPHVDFCPTDLCYKIPIGFTGFPHITFHFQSASRTADFYVAPTRLFHIDEGANYLCLAIFSSPYASVLGAMQQINYRFLYDIGNRLLAYAPDDCSTEF